MISNALLSTLKMMLKRHAQSTRQSAYALITLMLCVVSVASYAASPQDIRFAGKGNSLLGGSYHIYNVRCSDGSKRVISAWNKRKKWCIGKKKKGCTNDQLTTAKRVCK